jgi:hypothetical protein
MVTNFYCNKWGAKKVGLYGYFRLCLNLEYIDSKNKGDCFAT